MDQNHNSRTWKVFCWNVGINSEWKWSTLRDKIVESKADIVCLQETKKESFDLNFIRKICPEGFDAFEFLPSNGASGGVITVWKSRLFEGNLLFRNEFGISIDFKSLLNGATWILTYVYGPCTPDS